MDSAQSAQINGRREQGNPFKCVAPYELSGDQPQAVERLTNGIQSGMRYQTLLGVTGSGKTFTMAKTIERLQMPTLVLAPNKTLAAQLASELKEFFPNNAVNYFVSYYDYYQPEAYVPQIPTSRRIRRSTRKSRRCAMQQLRRCSRARTSLSSRP